MARHSALMDDIHNHRREWLFKLIKEQFDGNKERFARKVEMDSGLLHSNLINREGRNVGERLARRIEEKIGLPIGSLDQKPIETQPGQRASDRRSSQTKKPKRQRAAA